MRRGLAWIVAGAAACLLAACGSQSTPAAPPAPPSPSGSPTPASPVYPAPRPNPKTPWPRSGPRPPLTTAAFGPPQPTETPVTTCVFLHHVPPLAVGWTGVKFPSVPGPNTPAARWALWRWTGTRWQLVEVATTDSPNYLTQVLCAPAPDGSVGIASEWSSGGSGGAGAFRNWTARARGLTPVGGWLSVVDPSLTQIGPDLFREAGARDAYSFLWTKAAGWHLVDLGLRATIPVQAVQLAWTLRDGRPVLLTPPPASVVPGGPVAFVPEGALARQAWQIVGPFPTYAAADRVVRQGLGTVSMSQFVPGAVVMPPRGTSYWVLAVWPPYREAPEAAAIVRLVAAP
ncbi:MAG: hypothetical protein K6U14_09300 [Firmicutes bacterium]|nr:hypothetical protein [Alicyclobacillaceae bacterium]MCL6497807.1 hypothetical protein [Bacillota bacterium]